MTQPRRSRTPGAPGRCTHRQRGAYSLEYAMVFLLFFALIYTIVCYAIVFSFRFGLQNAAEDGARAALRYQPTLAARQAAARAEAARKVTVWLPVPPAVDSRIVYENGSSCDAQLANRCSIEVTVSAPDLHTVLPPFPDFALPNDVAAQARVLLDGRSL
ncbi:TadE/TadG family type IV pilus assembly protein [Pseudacidovorax sp. RU35E]|uniref:TadE/TadG family type IV pilus assembly protein n=1 Tax=Pseudacidovorax sp. RU35E TaxID=1907403 RepID=UPI000955B311|nr:TadE/TadG family type IV pilus assembly protein [Pseudacidovorax sp. RU35E]SIR20866.1 TadE-like protein [Pseudacidovorax sp. RU35E]